MDNVFLLRTRRDADRLLAQVGAGKHAVVVGGSFIAVEAAASLRARGVDVTVIAPHDAPFAHVFGERVGKVIQQHHERKNNITFQTGRRVKRITKHHGRAAGVELDDWTTVRADLVLLGLGVQPNTDFLRASTLNMGNDGSLIVNKHLQTNVPGVYAAGDIARYENRRGMSERVEHWRTAQQHGVLAARNMMGAAESVDDLVPFFWSRQRGGLGLLYVGHAAAWEDIVYRGDVEAGNFIAFYLENDRLRAAVSLGRDKEMCALEFILHNRLPLSPAQMQDDTFDLIAYAQRPR
jgi:NADPH-dependent 2,4-dienoyl-CoA reductase/sulfur reductase-like enzyme